MNCAKCGGVLYPDRQSIDDLAVRGFRGGRLFCLEGCTDIWLVERPDEPVDLTPRKQRRINGEHQVRRKVRVAICQSATCGQPFETTASVVRFCPECRAIVHAERERERGRMRRRTRAA